MGDCQRKDTTEPRADCQAFGHRNVPVSGQAIDSFPRSILKRKAERMSYLSCKNHRDCVIRVRYVKRDEHIGKDEAVTNPEVKVSEKVRELAMQLRPANRFWPDEIQQAEHAIQAALSELLEAGRKIESQMLGAAYMDENTQKKCAHTFAAILSKWEPEK